MGNEWLNSECEAILESKKQVRLRWLKIHNKNDYKNYKPIRKEGTK